MKIWKMIVLSLIFDTISSLLGKWNPFSAKVVIGLTFTPTDFEKLK